MICLDASVAVKLILDEEWSRLVEALLADSVELDEPIVAPPLLPIEVTNTLLKRMRPPTSFSFDEASYLLGRFLEFPIEIRNPNGLHGQALSLAHAYGLPAAYDAHYLALSAALGCDFWTDDRRLLSALGGRLPFVRPIGEYRPRTP